MNRPGLPTITRPHDTLSERRHTSNADDRHTTQQHNSTAQHSHTQRTRAWNVCVCEDESERRDRSWGPCPRHKRLAGSFHHRRVSVCRRVHDTCHPLKHGQSLGPLVYSSGSPCTRTHSHTHEQMPTAASGNRRDTNVTERESVASPSPLLSNRCLLASLVDSALHKSRITPAKTPLPFGPRATGGRHNRACFSPPRTEQTPSYLPRRSSLLLRPKQL